MGKAAVPSYLGTDFSSAPPGHRFGLYFPLWDSDWSMPTSKVEALKSITDIPDHSRKLLDALRKRQEHALAPPGREPDSSVVIIDAVSTAPFATGLGIEHPLENGFAFLNPYGLPYLPGASVKGVLRKAAQELGCGIFGVPNQDGWTEAAIDALFGIEDSSGKNHRRGALSFWDVIPAIIKGDKLLRVEIMTPHQSHYYHIDKKKNPSPPYFQSPHDSGQPTPIPFLTIPPGSSFSFHVRCDQVFLQKIAPELLEAERWKTLMNAAFKHAFDWLGFGAKTAVGYGAMAPDTDPEDRRQNEIEKARKAERQRQDEAAAEQARQAARLAEEARLAAAAAAFAALTDNMKVIHKAREALAIAEQLPELSRGNAIQALEVALKPIRDHAHTWALQDERIAAAQVLEHSFERVVGWFVKGVDKDKRKKQEAKRRAEVEAIRNSGNTLPGSNGENP